MHKKKSNVFKVFHLLSVNFWKLSIKIPVSLDQLPVRNENDVCRKKKLHLLGSNYYVRILSTIDRELLKTGASVALHKHSNALVDILPPESDSSISMLQAGKRKKL